MAEPRLTRFERWLAWLFGTPRGQFVFLLSCVGSLAMCVWMDGLAREYGRESVLAPNGDDVWRGIKFGAALGLVLVLSGLLHSVPRLLISPWRAVKNWEPTGWRLWVFYAVLGSHLLLMVVVVWTLFWWCLRSRFAFFPPICAMFAVQFLAGLAWRGVFGSSSQDEVTETVPTEN